MSKWLDFLQGFTLFDTAIVRQRFIETIQKYTPPKGKLLETGFGSAKTAILLSDLGYQVTAIDIDDELINGPQSRKASKMGVNIIKMNMFNLDFKDKSFDLIYHQGVLEHFDDEHIIEALREQNRVGKFVIFHVPNSRYPNQPFGDERLLSNNHWKDLIHKAGLRLVQIIGDQPYRYFHLFMPHIFYTKTFRDEIIDLPSFFLCKSSIFVAESG